MNFGTEDFQCEDCGACVLGYRYGQVPLCLECRHHYAPAALRAWAAWIVSVLP